MIRMDNPGISVWNKMTNLVILNLLVILTSIPVVTAGASLAAMHHVLYRMMKNEDGYLLKDYFRAFKENLKKATILWLLMLGVLVVLAADVWFVVAGAGRVPGWLVGIILVTCIVLVMGMMYVFPLQAHFENTVKNTLKNAGLVMILNLPRSVAMLLVYLLPFAAVALTYSALIVLLFCGFTLPAYISCFLYRKVFERMERGGRAAGEDF